MNVHVCSPVDRFCMHAKYVNSAVADRRRENIYEVRRLDLFFLLYIRSACYYVSVYIRSGHRCW